MFIFINNRMMDIIVHTFLSEGQQDMKGWVEWGAEKLEEGQLLSQFCLHQPSSQSWLPNHHHIGN